MSNGACNMQSLRVLSLLYSGPALRSVLQDNSLQPLKARVDKHKKCLYPLDTAKRFGHLLTDLYASMATNYCNEYVYKNTLLNKYILKKYSLASTTLLNEFKIGKSIADLILINGEVKLFEVKTELDTLQRLSSQIDEYQKVAEKVYIVTNSKYIEQVKQTYLATSIGFIEFSNAELYIHKEAEEDKTKFDHETIFKLLRKEEYLDVVREAFGSIPDVPNTLIFKECLKMVTALDVEEFQRMAFCRLKARTLKEPGLLTSDKTPSELRFLCHSLNMNSSEYETLFQLLNKSI